MDEIDKRDLVLRTFLEYGIKDCNWCDLKKSDLAECAEAIVKNLTVTHSSTQLKEKETISFEEWITQDIKRMEVYATFLDGFANGNLGNLYREYANEVLLNL